MTNARSDYNHLAKAQGQHPDIFYGSPLAVVGLFVEVIRARFKGDNAIALPWYWDDDPTPDPNETGEPSTETSEVTGGPGMGRKIYVESAYTSNNEARNYRPAVLVDKDTTQLLKPVIGNRAAWLPKEGLEVYYAIAQIPIEVMCLSEERGESAQIADFVWFHLVACTNLIREEFGIHDISPPVIGKTTPFRRTEGNKDSSWNTPIEFNVMVEYRWKTQPIAPLLESVAINLRARGEGDAETGAIVTATTVLSTDQLDSGKG